MYDEEEYGSVDLKKPLRFAIKRNMPRLLAIWEGIA